jgi:carbon storage regulator
MLVLSRKPKEVIRIGDDIEVVVLEVHGDRVKLGFTAPAEVPIHRGEVYVRIGHAPPALEEAECA